MLVGRRTAAQIAEIQSFGVHLSMRFTVGKERAYIAQCNAPEIFSPRHGAAHGRAQEPTPGSAFKHCWFLDTAGGGNPFVSYFWAL